MFLIMGSRPVETLLLTVRFVCHYCNVEADQRVIEVANRFSIFFIPVFTFSRRRYNECANCGGLTEVSDEQLQHARAWDAQRQVKR